MTNSPTIGVRIAVVIGSLIVAATALFHLTGYDDVGALLAQAGVRPFMRNGLQGLWLMFSIHLIVLAIAATAVVIRPTSGSRPVLIVVTALLLTDVLILLRYVGVFAGTIMLASGTALIASGIIFTRRSNASAHDH